MKTGRWLTPPSKITLLLCCLEMLLLFGACTVQPQIPENAIDELEAYWYSLPGSTTHDLKIVRAWPGKILLEAAADWPTSMEVWCVETELSGKETDSAKLDTILWFMSRVSDEASWESAPLMTMSSLWPYQSCGVTP